MTAASEGYDGMHSSSLDPCVQPLCCTNVIQISIAVSRECGGDLYLFLLMSIVAW